MINKIIPKTPILRKLKPTISPPSLTLNTQEEFPENSDEISDIYEKLNYENEIELEKIFFLDNSKRNIEDISNFIKSKLYLYQERDNNKPFDKK